jgi:mannose-6-phosphate isomerase-like protein (cupin superfamily)
MSLEPILFGPGAGEHYWFLNGLYSLKAGEDHSGGLFTAYEALLPPEFGPPPHVHRIEDEFFYVVEGEVTFWCHGVSATHGPGGTAFLPKGSPHRFDTGPSGAKMFQLTLPAQFERLVRAYGEPAPELKLPGPSEPDVPKLVELCAQLGIDILLPEPDSV